MKGRGIHYAARRTARWIDEHKGAGRLYYCKLDFVKFYESVDQQRIYDALCRMFRNKGVRYLLREAVTATERGHRAVSDTDADELLHEPSVQGGVRKVRREGGGLLR